MRNTAIRRKAPIRPVRQAATTLYKVFDTVEAHRIVLQAFNLVKDSIDEKECSITFYSGTLDHSITFEQSALKITVHIQEGAAS